MPITLNDLLKGRLTGASNDINSYLTNKRQKDISVITQDQINQRNEENLANREMIANMTQQGLNTRNEDQIKAAIDKIKTEYDAKYNNTVKELGLLNKNQGLMSGGRGVKVGGTSVTGQPMGAGVSLERAQDRRIQDYLKEQTKNADLAINLEELDKKTAETNPDGTGILSTPDGQAFKGQLGVSTGKVTNLARLVAPKLIKDYEVYTDKTGTAPEVHGAINQYIRKIAGLNQTEGESLRIEYESGMRSSSPQQLVEFLRKLKTISDRYDALSTSYLKPEDYPELERRGIKVNVPNTKQGISGFLNKSPQQMQQGQPQQMAPSAPQETKQEKLMRLRKKVRGI